MAEEKGISLTELGERLGVSVDKLRDEFAAAVKGGSTMSLMEWTAVRACQGQPWIALDDPASIFHLLTAQSKGVMGKEQFVERIPQLGLLCHPVSAECVFGALSKADDGKTVVDTAALTDFVAGLQLVLEPDCEGWLVHCKRQRLGHDVVLVEWESFVTYNGASRGTLLVSSQAVTHVVGTEYEEVLTIPLHAVRAVTVLPSVSTFDVFETRVEIVYEAEDGAHKKDDDDDDVGMVRKSAVFSFSRVKDALLHAGAGIARAELMAKIIRELSIAHAMIKDSGRRDTGCVLDLVAQNLVVHKALMDACAVSYMEELFVVSALASEQHEEFVNMVKTVVVPSRLFTTLVGSWRTREAAEGIAAPFELKLFAQHIDHFVDMLTIVGVLYTWWEEYLKWKSPARSIAWTTGLFLVGWFDRLYLLLAILLTWNLYHMYVLRTPEGRQRYAPSDLPTKKLPDGTETTEPIVPEAGPMGVVEKEKPATEGKVSGFFNRIESKINKLQSVHTGLRTTQNNLFFVNVALDKIYSLYTWRSYRLTRVYALLLVTLIVTILLVPANWLWMGAVLFFGTKRFRSPEKNVVERAAATFWNRLDPVHPVNKIDRRKEKE